MKKFSQHISAIIAVAAAFLLATPAFVHAANTSGNGMRVSPVRTDLVLEQGKSKIVPVYVRNVTGSTEHLNVIINDFVASSDESGAPALLLNGQTNDQHGLKKYMVAPTSVTVAPGQQKEVKVNVNLPKGLPGGGYYGAVRFAPTNGSGQTNISLAGSVGSLILVRVPGDVTEKLTLVSFNATNVNTEQARTVFTSGKNIQATVRFRNEGDVQEQPFGKVILKKGNKVLGEYKFNDSKLPSNVLPDSIRKFNIPLKKVGSFGKYTIVGNFGYGSSGQLLAGSTTFYVVPVWLIVVIVAIVLLILFLIFVLPKMIKSYNRSVVRKASRRR